MLSSFGIPPHHLQKVPVAGHAAAHADVVTEREPADGRGEADEQRVARQLARRLVGERAVEAHRRRQDWRCHFFEDVVFCRVKVIGGF